MYHHPVLIGAKTDWPEHKSKCMSEKNINTILDKFNAKHATGPVP
jgi:hypothetical protein